MIQQINPSQFHRKMRIDQHEEQDIFDLLPDAIVSEILNRVEDAKSLSACAVVCKRFGDLVAQTHNVTLEITRRKINLPPENKSRSVIARFILKPIYSFLNRRKSNTCCKEDDMCKLPNDLLKNFKEIRSLAVKLPGHDGDISSGAMLKWKAEFGKELQSCVIFGATGFQKSKSDGDDCDSLPPVILTNKQLKKRVIWTISCLIASSARHHMLKQIISMNRMIREVKISDGSKQGTIQMTEEQVVELRDEIDSSPEVVDLDRTKVPAVTVKMWYVPVLELPESGGVMKGATLAVIRPTVLTAVEKDDDVALAVGAFGESLTVEAVRKLIDNKKSYTLEMNSF